MGWCEGVCRCRCGRPQASAPIACLTPHRLPHPSSCPNAPRAGHGDCVDGRCVCDDGYSGTYCGGTDECREAYARETGRNCSSLANCTMVPHEVRAPPSDTDVTSIIAGGRNASTFDPLCKCPVGFMGPGHMCLAAPTAIHLGLSDAMARESLLTSSVLSVVANIIAASLFGVGLYTIGKRRGWWRRFRVGGGGGPAYARVPTSETTAGGTGGRISGGSGGDGAA